jgi:hypothetical protein
VLAEDERAGILERPSLAMLEVKERHEHHSASRGAISPA